MTEEKKLVVIDVTPTWRSVLPLLIAGIENGTPAGRKIAIEELTRLAEFADSAIANMKEQERLTDAMLTALDINE